MFLFHQYRHRWYNQSKYLGIRQDGIYYYGAFTLAIFARDFALS